MRARAVSCCLLVALALVAGALLTTPPERAGAASQQSLSDVQRKIDVTRGKIGRRKGTEKVLSGDIARWSSRVERLQGSITTLQRRQRTLQSDLDGKRERLDRTQTELREQRARLTRLRAKLERGRKILAARLVEVYTREQPDVVSVVLDSNGFADLVERGEFLARIQEQDANVLHIVKAARADATTTTKRLVVLEQRQQELTDAVQARRDEVAGVKRRLINTRVGYERTRAGKARALRTIRADRRQLETHLSDLQKESAKIQARLQGMPNTPIRQGSGRFIWPVNGTITSPFCESRAWEACHPGIDIAAPTGTPIRAADSGTVRIAGPTGGYGNFTCIAHSASLTTCYGHQSAIGVHVGQSVSKGQVIGRVGSTGFSTGPHLHFEVRVNGAVQNPMNYL